MASVAELDLMCTRHIFLQGVLRTGTLGGGRTGDGGVVAGARASPLLSDCCGPVRDGFSFQVAGVEALRVWPKLTLFPLSVCFPIFQHQDLCPRGGEC